MADNEVDLKINLENLRAFNEMLERQNTLITESNRLLERTSDLYRKIGTDARTSNEARSRRTSVPDAQPTVVRDPRTGQFQRAPTPQTYTRGWETVYGPVQRSPTTGRFERPPMYSRAPADNRSSLERFQSNFTTSAKASERLRTSLEKFEKFIDTKGDTTRKGSSLDKFEKWTESNKNFHKDTESWTKYMVPTFKDFGVAALRLYSLSRVLSGRGAGGSTFDKLVFGRMAFGGEGLKGGILGSLLGNVGRGGGRGGGGGAGGVAAAEEGGEALNAGAKLGAFKALGRVAGFAGAAITVAGMGAEAIYDVAEGATRRGRFARGLGTGVSTGDVSYAETHFAQYGVDAHQMLTGAAAARYDVQSPEYRAYAIAGIDPKDPNAPTKLMQYWAKYSKQLPDEAKLPIARSMGMEKALGGQAAVINIAGREPSEIGTMTAKERADLTVDRDTTDKYEKTITAVGMFGQALETIEANQLVKFTGALTTGADLAREGAVYLNQKLTDAGKGLEHFVDQVNDFGLRIGRMLGTVPPEGQPLPTEATPIPWGDFFSIWGGGLGSGQTPRAHSPVNNPPLNSTIEGIGIPELSDFGGSRSGATRIGIFTPKIEKLNKDVMDTSRSLAEFNDQLLRGSRIMLGNSGTYLASNFGKGNVPGGPVGLEGGAAPVYSTGGIGDTAMPRTLSEPAFGRGSGIGASGLGPGRGAVGGGGGGEANTIDTNAPEISQLPGDSTWGDYGTRANNPGNMEYAGWEGAASKFAYRDPHTGGMHKMAVFKTMQEGVAAAYKLMLRNQSKYGKTIAGALHGWAENSYIGPLAKSLGTDPNSPFDISTADPDKIAGLLQEQFRREGRKGSHTATRDQILAGVNLGRGGPETAVGGTTAGGVSALPDVTVPGNGTVADHLADMQKKGVLTSDQCVALATASVGIKLGGKSEGAWTGDWRRGEGAQEGGLKAGTPISTFLDRQGRTGNTYAIGGHGGQMGAGLDHAAVFESYIYDKQGNPIGMNVDEQYRGSGGIRKNRYMFNQGGGERNASNYYAIKTASGGYLGGANNPMTPRSETAERQPTKSAATPHMGDMSMYQGQRRGQDINIFNKAGGDINVQSAMLGLANGSFLS